MILIELVIGERQLSWLGHIHRMKQERLATEIYETRPQGNNKIGHPQLRCEDQVRQEAEKRRILWNETRRLAQVKNSWKRKIREMR
jgi:hypothetical protein